jgi:hypothetical protein
MAMADWGLVLASPVAPLARRIQLHSLLRVLRYYEAQAASAPSASKAYENSEERRHVVEQFLEDPGYADEATLEAIHAIAPDALSAAELETYRFGPWLRHRALRFAETLLHATLVAQTMALVVGLWSGNVSRFPLIFETLVSIWVILLYLDLIWSVYISRVARALLLNGDGWYMCSFEELVDLTVDGLPRWQRPAALLIAPFAKRLGPAGLKARAA